MVEVRQLPGVDHQITLSGKGAYTRVTCWARDREAYELKVREVTAEYGLFVVEVEDAMPFTEAQEKDDVSDKLAEQVEDTSKDENYCIFGTFHNYRTDN